MPVDARVTTKLKAKIWANEFIHFGQLITVTPNEEKFNISINTCKDSPGQPSLCLEPLQKPGLLLSRYFLEYTRLNFLQKLQPE